jgi:hypothetical protein
MKQLNGSGDTAIIFGEEYQTQGNNKQTTLK